ncbi:MAG: alpha-hydroxy-acid oxidizing protein, partial [Pseudomonadota bacterium]
RDDFTLDHIKLAIEMIEADALIIHLNTMQEAVQVGGDLDWTGIESAIESVCNAIPEPVIVKEVGMGISASVAKRLVNIGVSAIDVAGSGGTNFVQVEGHRNKSREQKELAEIFSEWGITTPKALIEIRRELPDVPLIASGGIRHGLDAAKSIRLGADIVAQAGPVLRAACESTKSVITHFQLLEKTLRLALACSEETVTRVASTN